MVNEDSPVAFENPVETDEGFDDDDFLDDDEEGEEQIVQVSDPFYYWNKAMFHLNDKLYFWVFKPAAQGYKAVTPSAFRIGVKNFFDNLSMPVRAVNCLLQGKGDELGDEIAKFLANSTEGVLGFGNPAKNKYNIPSHDEDFGQTLAVYGLGNGPYIVWPVLGSSTLRDSAGDAGDYFLDPTFYTDLETTESAGIKAFEIINGISFRIGDYESLKEAAIDPYDAMRDVYIQYRSKKVAE